MASFEDYDEFGNYIGADLDSDNEDEIPQQQQQQFHEESPGNVPLEGYDDVPMKEVDELALMEVDGEDLHIPTCLMSRNP